MNTKAASLWCLLGLALSLPAGALAAARSEITWDASRPLTWADFVGPVAANVAPEQVAVTAASLGWAYQYTVERSNGACLYRVTTIRAAATFNPNNSWVKPGHQTAAVLAHEQGHFDITQIHKLMLDDMSREFVGVPRPCQGKSTRRISHFIEDDIAGLLGALYEQVWQQHMKTQESYDSETHHGTRKAAQEDWLKRIAASLRSHRWK